MRRIIVSIPLLVVFFALFSVVASQTVPSQQTNQTQMQISSTAPLAPPPIEWNKTYGGSAFDILYSAVQTSDGGYALAGQTIIGSYSYFWLVRTDENGNMLWNKTYGSTKSEAYSIVQTSDGGFVLAGESAGRGYVVKTDSVGNVVWTYTDATSGTGFYSVTKTLDGGYAVAGWGPYGWPTTTEEFLLVKLSSTGSQQWWQSYGSGSLGGDDRALAVIQASDGGYVLVGYTNTYTMGYKDALLIKTDSGGHAEWDRKYGGADWDEFLTVIEPAGGIYLVGGTTWSHGPTPSFNPWLLMCSKPAGYITTGRLWDTAYNRDDYGLYVNSIVKADDGGYVIAFEAGLAAVDSQGNPLWMKQFPSAGFARLSSVVIKTVDGSYAFAGTKKIDWGNTDFWLIKVNIEPILISGLVLEPTNPPPYAPSLIPRQKEPVRVRAIMHGARTLNNVETALLNYRVNGSQWWNTTMSYNMTSGEWIAVIPGQPGNATVDFYVEGHLGPSSKTSAIITYTVKPLLRGDINGDGKVDIRDIALVVIQFGQTGP